MWYRICTGKDREVWDDGIAEHIMGRQLLAPEDIHRPELPQVGSEDY